MPWVKIFTGKAEAMARLADNAPRLIVIGDDRICLVRKGEDFFAIQDNCSHNGESLSKGKLNYLGEIICPWHNYTFDLQTGRECAMRSHDLKTYEVKVDETGLYIAT